MNKYERIQQLLDASPTGAPATGSFNEILRILFTSEEAALAVHMTLFPRPLQTIAASWRSLSNLCESMAA